FAGTGTTALAAEQLGRKWVALDINPKYREMFYRRMAAMRVAAHQPNSNRIGSVGTANLRLRQLKFGLLAYKRAAPSLHLTAYHVPLVFVLGGKAQRAPTPNWVTGCTIQVVLADEHYERRHNDVLEQIKSLCKEPPLSKFQLDAAIE